MNNLRLILRFLAAQAIVAYGVVFLTLEVARPDSEFNRGKTASASAVNAGEETWARPLDADEGEGEAEAEGEGEPAAGGAREEAGEAAPAFSGWALIEEELKRLRPLLPGAVILGCGLLLQFLVMVSVERRGPAGGGAGGRRSVPYPNPSRE